MCGVCKEGKGGRGGYLVDGGTAGFGLCFSFDFCFIFEFAPCFFHPVSIYALRPCTTVGIRPRKVELVESSIDLCHCDCGCGGGGGSASGGGSGLCMDW
jgi:hypothetical protein